MSSGSPRNQPLTGSQRSINAFMFNESKIVKNIVKVSSDTDDSSLFTSNIISLDEIADADYEMNNRLQEQESEDYYEHIVKGEYDEIDDNYGFSYDVILLKDKLFMHPARYHSDVCATGTVRRFYNGYQSKNVARHFALCGPRYSLLAIRS